SVTSPATAESQPRHVASTSEATSSNTPTQNTRRGRRKPNQPSGQENVNTTKASGESSEAPTQRRQRKPKAKKPDNSEEHKSTGQTSKHAEATNNSKPNNQSSATDSAAVKHSPRFNKNRPQGRLTTSSSDEQKKPRQNRPRRGPKAVAPNRDDHSSTLAHELKTSAYECMICCDIVRPAHQIWTCDCCWAVFHLSCAQKWANKSLQGKE
ncbi:Transcriptional repressor NF-X1, partial [Apophysomyces sp. BC1015]